MGSIRAGAIYPLTLQSWAQKLGLWPLSITMTKYWECSFILAYDCAASSARPGRPIALSLWWVCQVTVAECVGGVEVCIYGGQVVGGVRQNNATYIMSSKGLRPQ